MYYNNCGTGQTGERSPLNFFSFRMSSFSRFFLYEMPRRLGGVANSHLPFSFVTECVANGRPLAYAFIRRPG